MSRTTVAVVGGGVTGAGVARDLAMRGVDVALFERGPLTSGATGHMHGLLHSGARYAVPDPESARECIAENRRLRSIAPHCLTDTGGLFVQVPGDDRRYFERKLAACRACDVPAAPLSGTSAREREPELAGDVERAIAVPDATVDPFRLCVATALDAERRGARVETHAAVTDLHVEGDRIAGLTVRHDASPEATTRGGTTERVDADHVVNAAGAWAGRVAGLAGVDLALDNSKGAMAVVDDPAVDTVVNWCRPKGEADIVVPREATAVLGTTDEPVSDPDDYATDPGEAAVLFEDLQRLLPAVGTAATVHTFWGVRPLYAPDSGADSTALSRTFSVLDHGERDGLDGLTTVVGGKLTTHRLMAEAAADRVCDALGVAADCRTAAEPLPGGADGTDLADATARFGAEPLPGW
jgi:glycerol-3-phosphate dehydrogenase